MMKKLLYITGVILGCSAIHAQVTPCIQNGFQNGTPIALRIDCPKTFTGPLGTTVGIPVASAATITPTGAIFHVTGTTAISTINLPSLYSSSVGGCIDLIADGAWSTTTSGNIFSALTVSAGTDVRACYEGSKWYPVPVNVGTAASTASPVVVNTATGTTQHAFSGQLAGVENFYVTQLGDMKSTSLTTQYDINVGGAMNAYNGARISFFSSGTQALASAATIQMGYQIVTITGTTAITSITPSGLAGGSQGETHDIVAVSSGLAFTAGGSGTSQIYSGCTTSKAYQLVHAVWNTAGWVVSCMP